VLRPSEGAKKVPKKTKNLTQGRKAAKVRKENITTGSSRFLAPLRLGAVLLFFVLIVGWCMLFGSERTRYYKSVELRRFRDLERG
jgi:hypothetical protein